jgi:hypothetical protein
MGFSMAAQRKTRIGLISEIGLHARFAGWKDFRLNTEAAWLKKNRMAGT